MTDAKTDTANLIAQMTASADTANLIAQMTASADTANLIAQMTASADTVAAGGRQDMTDAKPGAAAPDVERLIAEAAKFHCVSQVDSDSWLYRRKRDGEPANPDDLMHVDVAADALSAAHTREAALRAELEGVRNAQAKRIIELGPWWSATADDINKQLAALRAENERLKRTLESCDKRFQAEHQQRKDVQAHVARLEAALREVEKHCPCGARPESPQTHPHVIGCPVGAALAASSPEQT